MIDEFRIDGEKLSLHPRRVADWLEAGDDWEKAKKIAPIYAEVTLAGACPHRCLTGDTLVNTIYGNIPIKELSETYATVPVYTYSLETKRAFIADAINIRKIGSDEKVVRVAFDDGTHIDCTADHKFLRFTTGAGATEWPVEAGELRPGNRLRAISRNANTAGYITLQWRRKGRRMRSRLVMDYVMGRKLLRTEHVHHKDHDITNDHPSNLEYCESAQAHADQHPEIAQRMRDNNPAKNMTPEWREKLRIAVTGKVRSLESRMRYRESKLGTKNPNYTNGNGVGRKSRVPEVNHKVVSVTPLEQRQDVYCLEVPSTGWFFANDVLVKNCSFCSVDAIGYPNVMMDRDILRDRLTEMGELGVKSVMYAGTGEPLLHKQASQIVLDSRAAGLDVAFTTNGVALHKLETLSECSWVKLSINGGTSETYSKVHKTSEKDWDRVWRNVADAAKRKGNCALGTQCVVLPENYLGMENLAKMSRDHGADYFVIKPYSQATFSIVQRHDIDYSKMRDYLEAIPAKFDTPTFKVIYRYNAIAQEAKGHEYPKCNATPFFWVYFRAEGDVFTCSAHLLDPRFNIGNINRQTFKEIWEGEGRRKNWELMRGFNIKQCRKNCRQNNQNKYLHAIKTAPHANFI